MRHARRRAAPGGEATGPGGNAPGPRGYARALGAFLSLALALLACSESPRHLLLVSVDTLRRDHIGIYGEERDLTPNLDALARESAIFEVAYAPTPFTRPSVAAMLTGRYPEAVGVVSNRHRLPKAVETLARRLRRYGFQTAAVVSNSVLLPVSGLHHGFETYDANLPQQERVRRLPERTAAPTTDAALRVLEGLTKEPERPFFLWVHYQDPHGPYTPPAELRRRYHGPEARRPDDPERLEVNEDHGGQGGIPRYQYLEGRRDPAFYRAGYAGEVRHTDEQIGRLLRALEEHGLEDETLTVFTADHGEGLGENDYWFAHGRHLTDALVRVPLLVRGPDVAPSRRRDVASLLDVMPTALARLGRPAPPRLSGRDLFAEGAARRSSVLHLATLHDSEARRGIVAEGWKYVRSAGPNAEEHLVALEGGPKAEPPRAVKRRMRARVLDRWRRVADAAAVAAPELSEEERRVLEALGYATRSPGEAPESAPAPTEPEGGP